MKTHRHYRHPYLQPSLEGAVHDRRVQRRPVHRREAEEGTARREVLGAHHRPELIR